MTCPSALMDLTKFQSYLSSPASATSSAANCRSVLRVETSIPQFLSSGSCPFISPILSKHRLRNSLPLVSHKALSRHRAVSSVSENGGSFVGVELNRNGLSVSGKEGSTQSSDSSNEAPQRFLPDAKTMDEVYDALAKQLMVAAETATGEQKYFVALAGPPGSGKSTVAGEVVRRINSTWQNLNGQDSEEVAVAVPMDGFHLYRWQLDCFEDPVEARARRGAPWTFNPSALVRHLARIQTKGGRTGQWVPPFFQSRCGRSCGT